MEVGMGGRFDATNAASGILSIITPIALDHSQYLGNTISLIAREKAGVIKAGRPVVSSSQSPDAQEVIRMHCREMKSPLYLQGSDFSATWESDGLAYSRNTVGTAPSATGNTGPLSGYESRNRHLCCGIAGPARNVFNPVRDRRRNKHPGRGEWNCSPVHPAYFSMVHTTRREQRHWRRLWQTSPGKRSFWWQALSETRTLTESSSDFSPTPTQSLRYALRFPTVLPRANLQITAEFSATRQATPAVLPRDWNQPSIKPNRMI